MVTRTFLIAASMGLAICACGDDTADGLGGGGSTPSTGGSAQGGEGPASGGGGTSDDGGAAPGGGGGDGGSAPGSCDLPNFPNETCTGVPAGTELTVVEGDMVIDTEGEIVEGLDIRGCVNIEAPGVVIRNSKITCNSFLAVASYANAYEGEAALLEDVEISCDDQQGTAVGDFNVTVRRANIHSCENGFDADGNLTIEDSFIHDLLPYNPETDPHVDGIQITPVGNNITIRHNTILAGIDGNAAIISPDVENGIVSNILIQDNLVAGGGWTIYCQQNGSGDNYRIVGNHFSTMFHDTVGDYGPWTECEDETEVTGNVIHETGAPLP
ncbi:MAG: hypothetical protein HOW73_40115 [Polyangiaceae bacterium]|nr:hypothetical protein [Polyangiaceae bacterium]